MVRPQRWAAAVECSRQPTWGKSGIFVATDLCSPCTTWRLGALFLQLLTGSGRQSGKCEFPYLMAYNVFLLTMLWGRGEQKNRALWVSLGGFLSWNDLSMANCSNSACSTKAHLHMSPLSEMCHALWGQRYWAGMRDGGTVSPQVLPPWYSLCVRGPATGWFSCACVPTPSPHLTISSASGNLIEEVLCLTEQAWWASFTAMPV